MLYLNSTFLFNYNQYSKEPLWYLYFYNSCCKFSNHSKKFTYMFSSTFASITFLFLYFDFKINFNFSIYYNFYSVYYLNAYFSPTAFYSKYALINNFFCIYISFANIHCFHCRFIIKARSKFTSRFNFGFIYLCRRNNSLSLIWSDTCKIIESQRD